MKKAELTGIIVNGVPYYIGLAPNDNESPCKYCDLKDCCSLFYSEQEGIDFEDGLDLGTLCRAHLSENQHFEANSTL